MDATALDLDLLHQLVSAWQARASAVREGGVATPALLARADTFDACAAQLAQALAAVRGVAPRADETAVLSLFPLRESV